MSISVYPSHCSYFSDEVSTIVTYFSHIPGGANILYMDGHVEFSKYPGDGLVSRAQAVLFGA